MKDFNSNLVCTLYKEGHTLTIIALQTGYSFRSVRKAVLTAGIMRTRGEGALLSARKKSSRPGTCRVRARNIWAYFNGPIPEGYHIHHKDGDPTNNHVENLDCIPSPEHTKIHKPWINSRANW